VVWTKVHDLPDFVYFSHEIHVNKGMGCASCHGRVDQMPLMYEQNTLQMEWCLDCHRNPAKNIRPTTEIYNMAWESPSEERPVWCSVGGEKSGVPTAQSVNCVTKDPGESAEALASITPPALLGAVPAPVSDSLNQYAMKVEYKKFTSQDEMGHFLVDHYKIRTPKDLASCEVCHR
jgi:hypothetical protein